MTATLFVIGIIIIIAIAIPVCGVIYVLMRMNGKCLASQYKKIAFYPGFEVKYIITLVSMFICGVFLLWV